MRLVRWVLVIPAAILGAFVAHGVVRLFGAEDSAWNDLVAHLALGYGLVWASWRTAPSYKRQTAWLITGLTVLGAVLGAVFVIQAFIQRQEPWILAGLRFAAVAAGAVTAAGIDMRNGFGESSAASAVEPSSKSPA